jgi:hypothetical protein
MVAVGLWVLEIIQYAFSHQNESREIPIYKNHSTNLTEVVMLMQKMRHIDPWDIINTTKNASEDTFVTLGEVTKGFFTRDGRVTVMASEGLLSVSNFGKIDPILEAYVQLDGTESTNLTEFIYVSTLNPGDKYVRSYEFKTVPPVKFAMEFDAYRDVPGQQIYLVHGKSGTATIRYKISNTWNYPLVVSFSAPIPNFIVSPSVNIGFVDKNRIFWNGFLSADKTQEIELTGTIESSANDYKIGKARLVIESNRPFSGVTLTKSEAITSIQPEILILQDKRHPNRWLANISIHNPSEFDFKLNYVTIYKDQKKNVIESWTVGDTVNHKSSWGRSFSFFYSGKGIPNFGVDLSYTLQAESSAKSIGYFEMEELKVSTARLSMIKFLGQETFSPASEKVTTTVYLTIQNTGTAPISEIYIEDLVPPGFNLDTKNVSMTLIKEGTEFSLNAGIFTLKGSKLAISVDHFDKGNSLTKGTTFKPKDKLRIEYKIVSSQPQDGTFELTSKGYGETIPRGPKVEFNTSEDMSIARRHFGMQLKWFPKTLDKNEYKIEWEITNVGEADIRNWTLITFLPEKVDIYFAKVPYTIQNHTTNKGRFLAWDVGKLKIGESKRVEYCLRIQEGGNLKDALSNARVIPIN